MRETQTTVQARRGEAAKTRTEENGKDSALKLFSVTVILDSDLDRPDTFAQRTRNHQLSGSLSACMYVVSRRSHCVLESRSRSTSFNSSFSKAVHTRDPLAMLQAPV